ncbi:MAG: anti-sigma B factor antagonist [Ideonella sp. MAG2]|nr:MAG: anti-sigma B factor antagonist [Ideonella sp. MAG2]
MSNVTLQGELSIGYAAQQREQLLSAWPSTDADCTLDLSAIEACDSSGVQLLIAAQKSATQRGGHCVITAASDAVRQALSNYGLMSLLDSMDQESAS